MPPSPPASSGSSLARNAKEGSTGGGGGAASGGVVPSRLTNSPKCGWGRCRKNSSQSGSETYPPSSSWKTPCRVGAITLRWSGPPWISRCALKAKPLARPAAAATRGLVVPMGPLLSMPALRSERESGGGAERGSGR